MPTRPSVAPAATTPPRGDGVLAAAALTPEQAPIVTWPLAGGHLLVQAGPGSGKTETVRARIHALLTEHDVPPEAILAVTFSRRAATDLALRLRQPDIWSGTFHAVGLDILEQWGGSIGLSPPYRIYAEERQAEALRQAIARAGLTPDPDPKRQGRFLRELKHRISRRKRGGRDDPDAGTGRDLIDDALMAMIHDEYCQVLAEAAALDYDDIISNAITVLRSDLDAAPHYRQRLRFVFIDEFHDCSPEQFELVRLLAPATNSAQVLAIADPEQAIYTWRGADATALLAAFRREYRPREVRLTRNFRSTPQIIAAANAVIGELRTTPLPPALEPARDVPPTPHPQPVDHVAFADDEVEAAELARFIERAVGTGRYAYGDIAVLYRLHNRAERAAAILPRRGIPIWRVEPDRFFQRPDVQEGLRYLELLLALHDEHFMPALNWPRVLVDEVTMVHLRRLARREGITVCELARRIDDFSGEISPLTRAAIRDFFATVAAPLGELVEQPIAHLIEPFLSVLRRRRSPIPRAVRAALRDTLDLLGRHLAPAAASLATAVAADRPIAVRAGTDSDGAAAIIILAHTLRCYLGRGLLVIGDDGAPPVGAFCIVLGQDQAVNADGFGLTVWETRHVAFSVATQAWRLGQLLLMHHEQAPPLPLVGFDLETGDRHPQTAEIIEIGAVRLDGDTAPHRAFARLVRPSGPTAITAGAGAVHGLTWGMVAGKQAIGEVLPELLDFLGDAVLVGHNIEDFDYPILRRVVRDQSGTTPRHLLIDTHKMARRVLPDQHSYRLEDLARLVDPDARQTHRVEHDIMLTGRLFDYLGQQHRAQLELDTLSEALPLVALSIRAAGVPIQHDNALLVQAGARAAAFGQGETLLTAWRQRVGIETSTVGMAWLRKQQADADDDHDWTSMEARWRDALDRYGQDGSDPSLGGFLRYAALAEPIDVVPLADDSAAGDGAPDDDDPRRLGRSERVTLMTVHAAKGLEWPLVFLLGVEDGQFPAYWARHDDDQLAEERRLLYVGMTRARHRLCLLWSRSVGGREQRLSQFLQSLPPDVITPRRRG